eukprot:gene27963-33766_t
MAPRANPAAQNVQLRTSFVTMKAHWLFFHYHKTGHDFIALLGKILSANFRLTYLDVEQRRVHNFTLFLTVNQKSIANADIVSIVPGMFTGEWSAAFRQVFPEHQFRVVHLVREPAEMILSGYRFHSQQVPPERWLAYPGFDFCDVHGLSGRFWSALVSKQQQFPSGLRGWLQALEEACRQARAQYGAEASFHEMLQLAVRTREGSATAVVPPFHFTPEDLRKIAAEGTLYHRYNASEYSSAIAINASKAFYEHNFGLSADRYPAVRLEAWRCLYTDLLNMALSSSSADPALVEQIYLDDLDLYNQTRFAETAVGMFSHLLAPWSPAHCPTGCNMPFTAQHATELIWKACSIERHVQTSSHASFQHVTKQLMPADEDLLYRQRLTTQDPLFAPLLAFLAALLKQPKG